MIRTRAFTKDGERGKKSYDYLSSWRAPPSILSIHHTTYYRKWRPRPPNGRLKISNHQCGVFFHLTVSAKETTKNVSMADLERKLVTLRRIIQQTSIRYLCPICLKGFPRPDTLYDHFRKKKDDTHEGLSMRRTDFKRFISSYQAALGASIPAAELPFDNKCFELQYVLEHRGQDSEKPHDTIAPGIDASASPACE